MKTVFQEGRVDPTKLNRLLNHVIVRITYFARNHSLSCFHKYFFKISLPFVHNEHSPPNFFQKDSLSLTFFFKMI